MPSHKVNFNEISKNQDSTSQLALSFKQAKVPATKTETMKVEDIRLDPKEEFTNLFPLDDNTVEKIADNIRRNSFYKNQALDMYRINEEPESGEFLGDGHHRLAAAKLAGIEEVPVVHHVYETRREALIAAYEIQVLRRNLGSAELFKVCQKLDTLKNPGAKGSDSEEASSGKSSEETARLLNTSARQVDKMRNIAKNGDEETIKAVEEGKLSINKADEIVNRKKKAKVESDSDEEEITDSLESNEGNPSQVMVHQRKEDDTPKLVTPTEDATDRWIKEKNIQIEEARKEAHAEGLSEGFQKCLYFVLGEVLKGRTPKEIYHDERLSDLSPYVICNVEFPEENEDLVMELDNE